MNPPSITDAVGQALRQEFLVWIHRLQGRYRYAQSKYALLLGEKWPLARQIAEGNLVLAAPSYFEIHPCEPCQLRCKYCRGELREVPESERMLNGSALLRVIREIHQLSPNAFLRFSGTIGEPLLHPQIADAFRLIRSLAPLQFGLTTNGLLLHKGHVLEELLGSTYVHVSLDAGSDRTYQQLKGGHPGDLERVLDNLAALQQARYAAHATVESVVSLVIQEENFAEIPSLSQTLRSLGVDAFELKMQHFDARRHMSPEAVRRAYEVIREVQARDDSPAYRVLVVQPEDLALARMRDGAPSVDFPRCYVNQLGLNATIDARGELQSCCQYYQSTLGPQGNIGTGLPLLWTGPQRRTALTRDPRDHCIGCSPSDEYVNRFMAFLARAHRQDPRFLDWAETHRPAPNLERCP